MKASKTLQCVMGHRNIGADMNVYIHFGLDDAADYEDIILMNEHYLIAF